MNFIQVAFLFFLCLCGCNQAVLLVQQQKVNSRYLASTNIGSPDPRTPPNGQLILAEWWVPGSVVERNSWLRLEILYKDFSQEVVEYPINHRIGYKAFSLVNEQFKQTGGFLAYRVEIITEDGEVFADWEHQLWFRLIEMEEDASRINLAVEE